MTQQTLAGESPRHRFLLLRFCVLEATDERCVFVKHCLQRWMDQNESLEFVPLSQKYSVYIYVVSSVSVHIQEMLTICLPHFLIDSTFCGPLTLSLYLSWSSSSSSQSPCPENSTVECTALLSSVIVWILDTGVYEAESFLQGTQVEMHELQRNKPVDTKGCVKKKTDLVFAREMVILRQELLALMLRHGLPVDVCLLSVGQDQNEEKQLANS